ncbi:MAG: hypothetical protein J6S36_06950 [Eggerthellaceae bacterium]|nr:hypothetical protein [Eggerthellaceae bacterium]
MPEAVDIAQLARSYFEQQGIEEVPVCGMEELPLVLLGIDGNRYTEVDGNIWMAIGGEGHVAYVGTSRHGGHMTLRPLFVKIDGVWRNAITGKVHDWGQSPSMH